MHKLLTAIISLSALTIYAAVPIKWDVETSRMQPVTIDAYHGETIDLQATFKSYGSPVNLTDYTASILWQTNGMDNVYWTTNTVTISSNVVTAVFKGSYDPGAASVRGFIALNNGSDGSNYRAAFTLRFRASPGARPNVITQPPLTLDLANTTVINPPWPTDNTINSRIRAVIQNDNITAICPTNSIKVIVSNTVDRAYVESLGISGGGGGCDTNAVQAIVDARIANSKAPILHLTYNAGTATISENAIQVAAAITNNIQALAFMNNRYWLKFDNWTTNTISVGADNYTMYTAYISGLNSAYNLLYGIISAAPDLGYVSAAITQQAYARPATTLVGYGITNAYTKVQSDAAFYPRASGEAWSTYWDGDDVRVTITNYYGNLAMPALYLEQRTNSTSEVTGLFRTVWDERTRWNTFLGVGFNFNTWAGFSSWKTSIESDIDDKADRAWGFYDSSTGDYAPSGVTSISSDSVMLSKGMSYQKSMVANKEVWVLTANEPYTSTGVSTNGFWVLNDAEGNPQVEIRRGDKVTLAAQAGSVTVNGSSLVVTYNIIAGEAPTGYVAASLENGATFIEQGAAGCPATVTWSGSSGAWVATVTPTSPTATKIFFHSTYKRGGDTILKSHIAVNFEKIVIGNTTYRVGTATISGNTVLTLTPVN